MIAISVLEVRVVRAPANQISKVQRQPLPACLQGTGYKSVVYEELWKVYHSSG